MNVIIPFKDLDADVQTALKMVCIREGKTLPQVGSEILKNAMSGKPLREEVPPTNPTKETGK
jgi:hypothetical protein